MKSEYQAFLLSLLGRWIFQILFFLNKVSIKGEENLLKLLKSGKPIMLCVWHGRLPPATLAPSLRRRIAKDDPYLRPGCRYADSESDPIRVVVRRRGGRRAHNGGLRSRRHLQAGPGWALAYGGAAVLGHVFSFWVGFKGGKGVATSAGGSGTLHEPFQET